MQLKEHIVYGGIVSIGLSPFFGIKSIFFFLGSVFIDADHYIDFLYYSRFKNWSVKKMFQFHGLMLRWVKAEKPSSYSLEAFHTVEFLLGLAVVAVIFQSTEVWLLWTGMVFHLCLDIYRIRQWGRDKLGVRAFSFVEYWLKRKKMRLAGIDPENIFKQAYSEISAETKKDF